MRASRIRVHTTRKSLNMSGVRQKKKRLLKSIVYSILLYGAEVWADALRIRIYRKDKAVVQRNCASHIACSYQTVSEPAVFVIADVYTYRSARHSEKKCV